jgi:hypothetical protein
MPFPVIQAPRSIASSVEPSSIDASKYFRFRIMGVDGKELYLSLGSELPSPWHPGHYHYPPGLVEDANKAELVCYIFDSFAPESRLAANVEDCSFGSFPTKPSLAT